MKIKTVLSTRVYRSCRAITIAALFIFQSSCADKFEWNRSAPSESTGPIKVLSGLVSTPFPYPAHFGTLTDLAVVGTGTGQTLFILDSGLKTIRRANTTTVTTLAGSSGVPGSTDGSGAAARFNEIKSIVSDSNGDFYLSDTYGIRKLTPSGTVTTLAGDVMASGNNDGLGAAARFNTIAGLTVDSLDNLYVADRGNHSIRRVTPIGNVTTIAGTGSSGSADGNGTGASFSSPAGVVMDSNGDLFIADSGNNTIRRMTPTGDVTVFAGQTGVAGAADGNGTAATFNIPTDLAIDSGDNLYVIDVNNYSVRKITPAGDVTTLAGSGSMGYADGLGTAASFFNPVGIASDPSGNLYVADGNVVRKITSAGMVTTLAGESSITDNNDGPLRGTSVLNANALTKNIDGNIYVAEFGGVIYKVTPAGEKTVFAGSPHETGTTDGPGATARFMTPAGIVHDSTGNLYVSDATASTIRKITLGGIVTTYAGTALMVGSSDGNGTAARFSGPTALAIDSGNNIYVADTSNYTLRKITPSGDVSTLAGTPGMQGYVDGTGSAARFTQVAGMTAGVGGNIFLTEYSAHTVRRVTPSGVVSTIAGTEGQFGAADGQGADARFRMPIGIAADAGGNLYVADSVSFTIRKIDSLGNVSTLAGVASDDDYVDGLGPVARFKYPAGLYYDKSVGSLYVTDLGSNRIRKID